LPTAGYAGVAQAYSAPNSGFGKTPPYPTRSLQIHRPTAELAPGCAVSDYHQCCFLVPRTKLTKKGREPPDVVSRTHTIKEALQQNAWNLSEAELAGLRALSKPLLERILPWLLYNPQSREIDIDFDEIDL
jgi:hypothetical protein